MSDFWKDKDYHMIGSRCSGKTTSLLYAAELRGIKNIVMAEPQVGKLKEQELGYPEGTFNFISYTNFDSLDVVDGFLIDEIDNFLHHRFFGYRGFTMSSQEF